jgi:hypothetical protein
VFTFGIYSFKKTLQRNAWQADCILANAYAALCIEAFTFSSASVVVVTQPVSKYRHSAHAEDLLVGSPFFSISRYSTLFRECYAR